MRAQSGIRPLTCFKAYDVRGRLGEELNEEIATRIGRAFATVLKATRVVLGRDPRASSAALARAVADGLVGAGVEVIDLGLCGTEEVYFATSHFQACGGICVTASHNPMDYNGLKMVKAGSAPLDPITEFAAIKTCAEQNDFPEVAGRGCIDTSRREVARGAYVACVLSFLDISALCPMKLVVNAGNGAAGPSFDAIAEALSDAGAPIEFHRMHHTPDGAFPNGIPNPLLPENRPATAHEVVAQKADMGIAWDGDFDRCFFFDHTGAFVPGEYVVGLLAEVFLAKEPGAKIVHDPRVIWNTEDIVARAGGVAVMACTGHAFIKQTMRDTGAIYGGEMSAHHYFRDFMACDSGMIPWLLVLELLGRNNTNLADVIAQRHAAFPSSGEINFRVDDPQRAMDAIKSEFGQMANNQNDIDGLSLTFDDWRLNVRCSNTEPLLRLNVEAKGVSADLIQRVDQISAIVNNY